MSILGIPSIVWAAGGGAAVAAGAFYGLFLAPRSPVWGRPLSRGPRGEPRVALTFDDGPSGEPTARILDTLADLRVPAAFFVIGRNVERYPKLVRRMDAEGHLVGNHTFDHHNLGAFGHWRYWEQQMGRTSDAIERVIGRRPALFRPPMGIRTFPISLTAKRQRMRVLAWSRRANDGVATTTARVLARLIAPARNGDVMVLHDGIPPGRRRDPAPTVAAIRPLVEGLRARGMELVRVDELLGVPAYAMDRST